MSRFLRGKTKPILNHLSKELIERTGIKWSICVKARFVKPKPDGEDVTTEAHFRSLCMKTVNQHELQNQLEEANHAATLDLTIAQYTPVKGSSYIPLPSKLKTKKAIINIKNSDNKCFMWSVLAFHVDRLHQFSSFKRN